MMIFGITNSPDIIVSFIDLKSEYIFYLVIYEVQK